MLKRLIGRILAAAAAAVVMAAPLSVCAQSDPDFTVEVNAPPKIVFLGDSIAAGFGLDGYSPDDNTKCASYANILSMIFDSELPEQANFSSENLAVDGLTSTKLLRNLKDGLYDSALDDADAVVLSIGGNDLLWVLLHIVDSDNSFSEAVKQLVSLDSTLDENLDRFESNISEIAGEITSRSDGTRLFIQTLYNPFEGYAISALDDLAQDKIGRLNDIIMNEAEQGDYADYITVADVAGDFGGSCAELTNIGELDIHPNAEGHAQIAKTLQPLIEAQTYTYYDYEAEREWKEGQLSESAASNEKSPVLKTAALICTAAAVAAAVIILNVKKNKEGK